MLGSFRIRMLVVVIIVTLVGLSMQSEHSSRKWVESGLRYVLKDYGVEQRIADFFNNLWVTVPEPVPAGSVNSLQAPCDYLKVEQDYGWYWNKSKERQEFSPGVKLKVKENTLIKPISEGKVDEISQNKLGRTILIEHDDNLYSFYAGLKEILVEAGDSIQKDTTIGKSGSDIYLELRSQDGPLDPHIIFK